MAEPPNPATPEAFAREALRWIPKILTLQDRNRLSPTYGCFDRNFWQYKIIDFPSGMSQEFVYPLALAWDTELPENPFYKQDAIREWAEAGMVYAALSSHSDGSCDDYFPFEKAGGAAAFSLLACAESYRILGLNNYSVLKFFERRADWLAHHQESGRLTNHQALIVLGLDRVGTLLGTDRWESAKADRLRQVLSWQDEEGWFQEYEGCDPGYHTLTISLLAQIYETHPTPELRDALERAIKLASHFIYPDGSFGGEIGSRNTYNFFPHGFELFGRHCPEATAINDQFLTGLVAGRAPCYADDHIVGHHTWNYLLAWRDRATDRSAPTPPPAGRTWLAHAGILIERRDDAFLVAALNKGGVFKFFRNGKLIASDTGLSLELESDGKSKVAVSHLVGKYASDLGEDQIRVSGDMGWAKQKAMTPFRLIVLRLIMLCGGRLFPNLIRKILQRVLITGIQRAPFRFAREWVWDGLRLRVTDRIEASTWESVTRAAIGCDQTSIYVVMSRTYQSGQLLPWRDLTRELEALKPGEPLEVRRTL